MNKRCKLLNSPIVSLPTPFAPIGTLELFSFFPSSRTSKSAKFSFRYLSVHSVNALPSLAAPRNTTAFEGRTYLVQNSWGDGTSCKSSTKFISGGLWDPNGFKWPTGTLKSPPVVRDTTSTKATTKLKYKRRFITAKPLHLWQLCGWIMLSLGKLGQIWKKKQEKYSCQIPRSPSTFSVSVYRWAKYS